MPIISGNAPAVLLVKILLTLYGIWNLDFFRYILSPLCLSPELRSIHIALLEYISAVYPFCLIAVTWFCIKVHSCGCKPVVFLWNAIKACFKSRMKPQSESKETVIDVFAAFLLLSYTKLILIFYSSVKPTYILSANSSLLVDVRLAEDTSVK